MYVNKVEEILNSINQPQSEHQTELHESYQNIALKLFLDDMSLSAFDNGEINELSALYEIENHVPFNKFCEAEATLIAEVYEAKKNSFQLGFCEGLKFMAYLTELRAR